jgi:hypothetical protein
MQGGAERKSAANCEWSSPWDDRATMAAMRRRPLWPPLGLAAVVLLAGCGGSKTYSLEKTRACLSQHDGVTVIKTVDFVASTALGGAFTAKFPHNQVTISFGLDSAEAERLATAYRRFRGRNIGIEDILRPDHNAVLLWKAHPSSEDEGTILGCLE